MWINYQVIKQSHKIVPFLFLLLSSLCNTIHGHCQQRYTNFPSNPGDQETLATSEKQFLLAYLLGTLSFNLLLSSISSHDVNLIGQAICPKLSLIRTSHEEYWPPIPPLPPPLLLPLPLLPWECAEFGGVGLLSLPPLCRRSERCRRHRRCGEQLDEAPTMASGGGGGVVIRDVRWVLSLALLMCCT